MWGKEIEAEYRKLEEGESLPIDVLTSDEPDRHVKSYLLDSSFLAGIRILLPQIKDPSESFLSSLFSSPSPDYIIYRAERPSVFSNKLLIYDCKRGDTEGRAIFEIERDMFRGGLYCLFAYETKRKLATVLLRTQLKLDSEMDISIHYHSQEPDDYVRVLDANSRTDVSLFATTCMSVPGVKGWRIFQDGVPLAFTIDQAEKKVHIVHKGFTNEGETKKKEDLLIALNILINDLLEENLTHFG